MFTRQLLNLILLIALPVLDFAQTNSDVSASFTNADSVCAGSLVNFYNTSVGASNYYWSFCGSVSNNPSAINFGNVDNQFSQPVFIDYGLDNGNYYGIVTNHIPGKITRLNFGSSLLNTPTAEDLGNFNNIIGDQTEGIQVLKTNGRWYAIIVGGGDIDANASPRIVKLDFGNSLSNNPTATNWGNIGDLDLPIDFQILQVNGSYYGFTMNVQSNTITRFNFGSDFTNAPSATNLGNIGNLDYPDGFNFVNKNGKWFAFVVNNTSNALVRLDFGTSLLNTPTAVNIPNPGNSFNQPRDITFLSLCNGIFAYVLNSSGNIIKLNFGDDIASIPTADDLGNIGGFAVPHSFTNFFSTESGLYAFIPNAFNNTLSRIKFASCQTIPTSTQKNPGSVTYTTPGIYSPNLLVDIGLPTQTSFCKQLNVNNCAPPVTASFTSPDTICTNTKFSVKNTSTNATNYTWSFCDTFQSTPSAVSLANPGGLLYSPVFIDYGLDNNGNYYGIATNHLTGKITRLNFGNSLLNNPTAEDLGTFNDVLPTQLEGIQVRNVNGKWYAITVGGGNQLPNSSPRIVKLDFGNSLTNTPIVTNWGNIGGLDLPIDFQIIKENGNYYGFTMNVTSNTITRFDFGSDFTNPPQGINLGNIGNLQYPDGFTCIKHDSKWFAFVVNSTSGEITRLSFGTSLVNIPTATQIQNPDGLLSKPRDIAMFITCNNIFGYVVNAGNNNFIKLDFGNDIATTPTATNLGNIGHFNFPHSFSSFFSNGSNIYSFIPNVTSGELTRINFEECQKITGSNKQNPDSLIYPSPGLYNVTLLADIGLPTQTSFCKQIIAKNCISPCDTFKVNAGKDVSICYGTSTQLKASGAAKYKWNTSKVLTDTSIANPVASPLSTTSFIVTGHDITGVCSDADTVVVSVLPLPIFKLSNDTSICNGSSIQLSATATVNNYHYRWSPGNYLADTSISNPSSIPLDSIEYYVTATDSFNCQSKDSVQINVLPVPTIITIKNSRICYGDSILLSTTSANANTYLWSPDAGLSSNSIVSPKASPKTSTKYFITASNSVCAAKDSVTVSVLSLPKIFAGNDTVTCGNGTAQLNASGGNNYQWQPTTGLSDSTTANPIASPAITTTYRVTGTDDNGCKNFDLITVQKVPDPVFAIHVSDSAVCFGKTVSLTASGGNNYSWTPAQLVTNAAAATTSATIKSQTSFSVNIYDKLCKVSKTLNETVAVKPLPVVNISKSNDIDCGNLKAQLIATGGTVYTWLPTTNIDNPNIANPVVNPLNDTWYTVSVKNSNECMTDDSILVKSVVGVQGFEVANAFTPNGDGLNDCFGLRYWGTPASFDMKIFDKWGMQVFHSTNISDCWDGTYKGKKQGSGTFVYIITAASVCNQQKVVRKGTIVLIR